ncbi:phage tail protein [Yersinia alsatica]|uniref:phage tail protein n=1 Tax=Yersinia alsatica TaxID=2890317 RepID=UPI0011AAE597|nr:phage tail protein [Yersinia alsatica]
MQKIGDIPNTRADSNGEFTDGNVAAGVPPTILPAEWFNTLQRELIKVVQDGGLALDPNDDTQVLAALKKLFLQSGNNLSEIKAAGPTAVAAALENLGLGDATKIADVKALIDAAFPIGIPLPYPLADIPAPAQGIVWFKMNGGSFNTATYPKLAAKYTTGVLPDLRGEFIRGFDDGRGVRADQKLLGWQGYGIQSHNHGITNFEVRGVTGGPTSAWFTSSNGVATSNSGGDETRPRNIAFSYIVRAA